MKRRVIVAVALFLAAQPTLCAATLTPGVASMFTFGAPNDNTPTVIPIYEYLAAGPSTIRVVDMGYEGDEFQFIVDGVPYLTHIPVPGASDETGTFSFETVWADPHLSRGTAFVSPGLHTIESSVVAYSVNTLVSDDGAGFIRADEVPEPNGLTMMAIGAASLIGLKLRRSLRTDPRDS
ncbi:MAG TPA: hypothetical protein VEX68_04150 [Bryobacteraceae bacterium]|nr:hypothetical protein [Bryobacteraceae bacterium]